MKPDSGQKLRETAARQRLEQSDSELSPAADPMIGTVLSGHLEILNFLGRGGMSVVYKAKDLLLNRHVAVKLLLAHNALDPKQVARFRQEAMAASKLDHPNIIRIFEFNIPEQGPPYLVMDYIEGQSLADLISSSGAIEQRRAISIMAMVLDGLEHAHKEGVVHRDLKPGNIMLLKDASGKQTVKIVDFGIAKLVENDQAHGLTQTGELFGSPLYMSPEQCLGKKLDKRTDIYALGCVMYEMLTGKPPLKGATVLETIQLQTTQMPESVRRIHPGIKNPDKLDALLLKCLAKDPEQRFQNAADFKSALQDMEIKTKESLFARAKLKWQLKQLKDQSSKPSLAALTACGLAVVLGVSGLVWWWHEAQLTKTAPAPQPNLVEWTDNDRIGQENFDSGKNDAAEARFLKAQQVSKLLGLEYEIISQQELIDFYTAAGKTTAASQARMNELFDQENNHARELLKKLDRTTDKSQALNLIKEVLSIIKQLRYGREKEAQDLTNQLTNFAQKLGDERSVLDCLYQSAGLAKLRNDSDERLSCLTRAVEQARQLKEGALQSSCLYALAECYRDAQQFDKAIAALEKGRQAAPNSVAAARCDLDLSDLYRQLGESRLSEEAKIRAERAFIDIPLDKRDDEYLLTNLLSQTIRRTDPLPPDFTEKAENCLRNSETHMPRDFRQIGRSLNVCMNSTKPWPTLNFESMLRRKLAITQRIKDLSQKEELAYLSGLYGTHAQHEHSLDEHRKSRVILCQLVNRLESAPLTLSELQFYSKFYRLLARQYLAISPTNPQKSVDCALKYVAAVSRYAPHDAYANAAANAILAESYIAAKDAVHAEPLLKRAEEYFQRKGPQGNDYVVKMRARLNALTAKQP